MTAGLLHLVAIGELGALSAMFAAFLAHSLWVALTARPTKRRLVQLRQDMVRLVGGDSVGKGRIAEPESRHHPRLYQQALEELASNLSGNGAAWIEQAAREMGLFDQAARWCRSYRWWHRLRGVRLFSLLGAGDALVPARLGDTHPMVRAAAARWVVRYPSPALVEGLIATLADPDTRCRLAAEDVLIRLGATAAGPLAAYLSRTGAPQRELALKVAVGLADARFLEPGLSAAEDLDPAVRTGAATLLAAVGGSRPEQALIRLLGDPSEQVRVAAAHGLGMLGSWTVAPDLARQLRDPAWDVRREAALSLRRLGATGRLYLRRALADPDPYAADMAHQVLDLPRTSAD
ncbi:MAG: HEAT repeat domain-containing protein [Acidimicrobiales bacterium]